MVILGLLAHDARGDEQLDILLHRWPDEICTDASQGLCHSHVAASGSVVEFCEDGGDGLKTFGKPYTTLLKDEVMTYGAVGVEGSS